MLGAIREKEEEEEEKEEILACIYTITLHGFLPPTYREGKPPSIIIYQS